MNELDTRAERFLESIRAEGEAACAAIRTETDAEIDRQLDEARQAQQAKAEHTLHFETERARTRANRELSAARMQARAKLAAQRQQIAADTFAADNPIAFLSMLSVSPISCVLLTIMLCHMLFLGCENNRYNSSNVLRNSVTSVSSSLYF